jgi:predicted nucleotidyltransferase
MTSKQQKQCLTRNVFLYVSHRKRENIQITYSSKMSGNYHPNRIDMSMDKATAIENAKRYAGLVCKELSPCKVVLYGSLANGGFHENSDIDIAVIKNIMDDDYWELSKTINRLTRHIDSRIEPVLLNTGNDRSGFFSTIMKTGIVLTE